MYLSRTTRPVVLGAVVLFVLSAATEISQARAPRSRTVPHREIAFGQVVLQIDPTPENPVGRQEFVAFGFGTHLGRYTQVGGHDFFLDGTLIGEFVTTAADGSTISGVYHGTFEDIGRGLIRFEVTAEWLVGTGRLEGVTGIGEVVAILDSTSGRLIYRTDADWTRTGS